MSSTFLYDEAHGVTPVKTAIHTNRPLSLQANSFVELKFLNECRLHYTEIRKFLNTLPPRCKVHVQVDKSSRKLCRVRRAGGRRMVVRYKSPPGGELEIGGIVADVSSSKINQKLTFHCPNARSHSTYVKALENCLLVKPVLAHLQNEALRENKERARLQKEAGVVFSV